MTLTRRGFLRMSGIAALALGFQWSGARVGRAASGALGGVQAQAAGSDALHVLKRLTWGIRPDDWARIDAMGIEGYIDWQLHPESIPDPLVDEFVAARRILTMSAGELREMLEQGALVVPAFGYRSRTLPIFDDHGRQLALNADEGGRHHA